MNNSILAAKRDDINPEELSLAHRWVLKICHVIKDDKSQLILSVAKLQDQSEILMMVWKLAHIIRVE